MVGTAIQYSGRGRVLWDDRYVLLALLGSRAWQHRSGSCGVPAKGAEVMTLLLQVVATVAAVWLAFLAALALDEGGA